MLDSEIPVQGGAPCSPLYLHTLIKDGSSGQMAANGKAAEYKILSPTLPPHPSTPELSGGSSSRV